MKIIFDSEEQKKEFEANMDGCCPSILGLKGDCDKCDVPALACLSVCDRSCHECWECCGLEMEIRGE